LAAPVDIAQCLAEPGVLAGILQGDRAPPLAQAIADNMESRALGKNLA